MLPAIYFNALYQPDLDRTITPLCSLKVIKLWSGYYLRDDPTFFLKPSSTAVTHERIMLFAYLPNRRVRWVPRIKRMPHPSFHSTSH